MPTTLAFGTNLHITKNRLRGMRAELHWNDALLEIVSHKVLGKSFTTSEFDIFFKKERAAAHEVAVWN